MSVTRCLKKATSQLPISPMIQSVGNKKQRFTIQETSRLIPEALFVVRTRFRILGSLFLRILVTIVNKYHRILSRYNLSISSRSTESSSYRFLRVFHVRFFILEIIFEKYGKFYTKAMFLVLFIEQIVPNETGLVGRGKKLFFPALGSCEGAFFKSNKIGTFSVNHLCRTFDLSGRSLYLV